MSVFLSFLKISTNSLELLKLYPEAGEIMSYRYEIENPDDWESAVKPIISKQGLAKLESVYDQIPQLIQELSGQSAESAKGGIWFLPEEFEQVATPDEIEYLVSMNDQAHTFDHIDSDTTYWLAEDVARIAGIISRVENPFAGLCEEDEVDPFSYIIDAAKDGYAMLVTVC